MNPWGVSKTGPALVRLEDYAKAFARDMPEEFRMNIRSNQRR
jgi:hypothetical protein